jgi:hypothetical protein
MHACIHSDVSNKLDLTFDDLSTSTSHIDFIDIKPVIGNTACLDNSCLTNHVMPKSKESEIQGKFIPKCHNCEKISHIRLNYYLLKSHKPWIKQDALRKSKVEDSLSSKYVPPHIRHIKGKSNVICKNVNHNFAKNVKKHSNKRNMLTAITVTSPVTSNSNVHSSRSRRFRGGCQQELHQALYLRWHIRLHGISRSLFLPIRVTNQKRTNQGATRESRRSPIATMTMKGF